MFKMGRPRTEIDPETLLDLAERGLTQKQIAAELGISIPTVADRIRELQQEQGVLLQYKQLEGLHLTKLRARILEAIKPELIDSASLKDLVYAYRVLKGSEIDEDPGKVKGLVAYLIEIEKKEIALKENPVFDDQEKFIEMKRDEQETWKGLSEAKIVID